MAKAKLCLLLALWIISTEVTTANTNNEKLDKGGTQLKWSRREDSFDLVRIHVTSDQRTVNSTVTPRDGVRHEGARGSEAVYKFTATKGTGNVQSTEHLKNIVLSIKVGQETFLLDLHINSYMFSSNYSEKMVSDKGENHRELDLVADHCYYVGSVRNYPESVAAVSTCHGIVGFFTAHNQTYHVEPVNGPDGCVSCRHRVYHGLQGELGSTWTCGVKGSDDHATRKKRAAILNWPQDLDGKTRIVELYVVVDNNQYMAYGSNIATVTDRTKTMVNLASALFQSQDIYVVLVGLEIWTGPNKIIIDVTNISRTLDNFIVYKQSSITTPHDNAQFVTSVKFDGTRQGWGNIGEMCSSKGGLIVSDRDSLPGVAATVTAHEIGHNLGLLHDEDYGTSCPCTDPSGLCIMNSITPSFNTPVTWSKCSTDRLGAGLPKGLDECLNNMPPTLFDPSSPSLCGDGLVQTGEQCDCGAAPSSECNKACCDSVTCQLVGAAECAYGRCCDVVTCKRMPRYTLCRSAMGPCDLGEYCSGSDHICPTNVYKKDFSDCTINSISAYCTSGLCRTKESQCVDLWGTGVGVANDLCFLNLNVFGNFSGHCGFVTPKNFTAFKACAAKDALCGKLHCDQTALTIQYKGGLVGTASLGGSLDGVTQVTCNSVTYETGVGGTDRGLVPSGANCGTGKVCRNQECIDVATVAPVLSCPNCNSRGVCNSLDQCHCDVGFAPPNCLSAGEGGSVHSNPILPLPTSSTMSASTLTTTVVSSTTSTTTQVPTVTNLPTIPITSNANTGTNPITVAGNPATASTVAASTPASGSGTTSKTAATTASVYDSWVPYFTWWNNYYNIPLFVGVFIVSLLLLCCCCPRRGPRLPPPTNVARPTVTLPPIYSSNGANPSAFGYDQGGLNQRGYPSRFGAPVY